jgi:class 3 adenylate cyclase/YHS domain-containing protein/DNA-binding transcriptional MerR regulator
MADGLTIDALAELTGEAVGRLQEWVELTLISPDHEGRFSAEQAERARLVQYAAGRGVGIQEIARVCTENGDLLAAFVRAVPASALGCDRTKTFTLEETATLIGVERALLDRIRLASGLRDQTFAYPDDIDALRWVAISLEQGIPEDVLLQLIRVFADATNRVADSAYRLFHLYVHEQLRADGLTGSELIEATQAYGIPLAALVEPALLYFHRKAWERASRDDLILHLMEEWTSPSAVPGELLRTVIFVDLSRFTPLSDAMGDVAAAQVVERFGELVREATARCHGQVVKQIGDAFMVVFVDASSAVTCALTIEDQVAAEPKFPAIRMGAHTGSLLYREGDYVGVNVNIAARVAAEAGRHQLIITDSTRAQAGALPDVEFTSLGRRRLKGLAEELELIEVRTGRAQCARAVDPVCGMELDEESSAATLQWDGRQLLFCSAGCLQRFLAAPERYQVTTATTPEA